jgi:hypothetical protein
LWLLPYLLMAFATFPCASIGNHHNLSQFPTPDSQVLTPPTNFFSKPYLDKRLI